MVSPWGLCFFPREWIRWLTISCPCTKKKTHRSASLRSPFDKRRWQVATQMHVLCQSCQPLGQDWDWDHKIVFCRDILCFGFVFGSYVHFGWEVHVFCVLSTILCDCPCWPACSLGVPAANHYCKMQTNGFHDFMTEIAHVTILCGPCHCSICSGLVCLYLPRPGWWGLFLSIVILWGWHDGIMVVFHPWLFRAPNLSSGVPGAGAEF